jgi:hypothetical protein
VQVKPKIGEKFLSHETEQGTLLLHPSSGRLYILEKDYANFKVVKEYKGIRTYYVTEEFYKFYEELQNSEINFQ